MYYPYFIAYMVAGFVISLIIFYWAVHHGQFKDQQRARFLPLEGELDTKPVKTSKIGRLETYALLALACCGLATTAMVLAFAALHPH
jgi:cbb3-type cytochrome oxidase maturation protein